MESSLVTQFVLRPLVGQDLPLPSRERLAATWATDGADRSQAVLLAVRDILSIHTSIQPLWALPDVASAVTAGEAVLLIDGIEGALRSPARGFEERGVEEPDTETVIRGPRDGFTESLANSIALIRRKLRDTALRVETTQVGHRSQTDVAVLYIADVADPHLVREVKAPLSRIHKGKDQQLARITRWPTFDLRKTGRLAGHARLQTSARYTRPATTDLEAEVRRLEWI